MADEREILTYLRDKEREILEDLREFVSRETPSHEKILLDDFAGFLADYASKLGAEVEIVEVEGSGNHVIARWNQGESENEAPVFLLGHYDTVWEAGTIEEMPFTVEDGVVRGPGVFDMKCGLVQGFWAIRVLRELGALNRPVVYLCNSDEEIGSPTSRALIEDLASRASHVLVLEPSLGGALKTARKGVGIFRVEVHGRSAHAGLDPESGVSAVEDLADLIARMKSVADPEKGTTVNVGTVSGGTRFNVVAARATAEVDARVATAKEAGRVVEWFTSLEPRDPEARLTVEGGMNWPPMERTPEIAALYEFAKDKAAGLGFDLAEGSAGGASDGCYCAAVGAAVLDGLGAVGDGAHAIHEHVRVEQIPERAALVATLIQSLETLEK